MIDIKIIRQNPELLRESIKKRNMDIDIDGFIKLDATRLHLTQKIDTLRAEKNTVSKQIPVLQWSQKEVSLSEMKKISEEIKTLESEYKNLQEELLKIHRDIPNILSPEVPLWKDDTENQVLKKVWKPKKFDFEPKDHHELWEMHDFIDKKKAALVTGARFYYLKWDLVQLQYALVNFSFDVLSNEDILKKIIQDNNLWVSSKPFRPIIPPLMIHYDVMEKMGRLHPMEDRYCYDNDKQALIWSAEHTLGPLHMGEVLKEEDLPIRYFANTPAFRREAGTYGKDSRGIFRVHQFDKIEMESFTTSKDWAEEQKFIVAIQEYLVKSLGIPYQLVNICSGDIWKPDYRQFDIECFFPWQNAYRETHTSDYMTDFQSYSLQTRVLLKNGKKEFAHMNDATAFALGRILACIMENNQTRNGKITIPHVLQKYMGGKKEI